MLAILLIVPAITGQASQTMPTWAQQVLSSKSAVSVREGRRAPQERSSKKQASNAETQVQIASANPLIDPAGDRVHKTMYRGLRMVDFLVQKGKIKSALRYFDQLEAQTPIDDRTYVDNPFYAEFGISLEYLAGDLDDAYADTVDAFSKPVSGDRPWLLLAMVAAAKGQVFSGELEYCKRIIESDHNLGASPLNALPDWSPNNPKDVEAAACLAYVFRRNFEVQFAERARALCPRSPAIAAELLSRYAVAGEFSKARKLARGMISSSLSEVERNYFAAELLRAQDKADVPPKKPVFDDGGA